MAGLLWMSVSLLLFKSCMGVTETQLAPVVDEIWKNFKINTMFSLAASIPKEQNQEDQYDMSQVLNDENPETVKTTMKTKKVYAHGRIVAAKVIPKPGVKGDFIHAEYRVLQNFDNLLNQQFDRDNDLMLFYVRAAPCVQKCTDENNPESILKDLPKLKEWTHYAFAFSELYLSKNPLKALSADQRRAGVQKVGDSLGLKNVFRCRESNGQMECRSCADQNDQVADFCVSDPPSTQSNDENSGAPAVPNTLIQPAPSDTEAGNTMTDDNARSQGEGATEGNQDNIGQGVTEEEQTRRVGGRGSGESIGGRGGRQRIGGSRGRWRTQGRRGRGRVPGRRGRWRTPGRRGRGRVPGRRGGRWRTPGRRGRGRVPGRRGRGMVPGRRGRWRTPGRRGRGRVPGRRGRWRTPGRRGRGRVPGRRGRGRVPGRRGGRWRTPGRRGRGRVPGRRGRWRTPGRRGRRRAPGRRRRWRTTRRRAGR